MAAVAGAADFAESGVGFRAALAPAATAAAEKSNGVLNGLLVIRLFAILAFLVGLPYFVFSTVMWLWLPAPLSSCVWLAVLAILLLQQSASGAWSAKAMLDAGLGSVRQLQFCWKPEEVVARLSLWKRCSPVAFLAVRRTLWRDIIGYIPSYSATFIAAFWLVGEPVAGVLHMPRPLPAWQHWLFAAALPLLGAISDWGEDAIHLQYLRLDEDDPPSRPTGSLVTAAFLCSGLKVLALLAGLMALAIAAGWLVLVAFVCILDAHFQLSPELHAAAVRLIPAGTRSVPCVFNLLAVLAAVAASYVAVKSLKERRRSAQDQELNLQHHN